MEIRISNLSSTTTEKDVRSFFAPYKVMLTSQVKTITDASKIKSATYCFVTIDNRNEGESAVQQLNGTELLGTAVLVEEGK